MCEQEKEMHTSERKQTLKKRQWYYRGSLKSCNYSCSYCPFSKKRSSPQKLEKDRQQFFRFIEKLEEQKNTGGAVLIVPYGEALIHKYYWEGLAKLSRNPRFDAVGAQSNFSFPVDKMLKFYEDMGGDIGKLRLWGTFHPEMTSVEDFVSQCEILEKWKAAFSVGAVGVPEQISDIRKLRKMLNDNIYLWINKMDGLGRNYTESEIKEFLAIDEYFELELKHFPADGSLCKDCIFVEADGRVKKCVLCRQGIGNFYDKIWQDNLQYKAAGNFSAMEEAGRSCLRKECSCYLAYNNRNEKELFFFQPYPAFRIPNYPRAIFFDVDGTLVPEGAGIISESAGKRITALAKRCDIYLATSLPPKDAVRKTQGIGHVIKGGVFANGARCIIREREYDAVYPMETEWLGLVDKMKEEYGFRVHIYQKEKSVYKITLAFPKRKLCRMPFKDDFFNRLAGELRIPENCRWIVEENGIQIISAGREKLKGILEISQVMGYRREEVMVVGNSDNDVPMLEYFPLSVAVRNSSERAKEAAKICL